MRPKLLDLFCGAGGAAMGYYRAGFEVVGVDIAPQPHFPFAFVQGEWLAYLDAHGHKFDVIHASPPCQAYSRLRHLPWMREKVFPRLLAPTLQALRQLGKPWIVENVAGAPLDGLVLCGTQFGLPLYRHRCFASNLLLLAPPHEQHIHTICPGARNLATRYPRGGRRDVAGTWSHVTAEAALGIDWMTRAELSQAIPPAYTEWIGRQLLTSLTKDHHVPTVD